MIPIGYMAKRVSLRPAWIKADRVKDIYSVSGCVSKDFADYINYWKHNGYWFFDSPAIILEVARDNAFDLERTALFYYEAHELESRKASIAGHHSNPRLRSRPESFHPVRGRWKATMS